MVKKTSKHGKPYNSGCDAIHFAELLEIALDEPEAFQFLLDCFDQVNNDIEHEYIVKLIEQLI